MFVNENKSRNILEYQFSDVSSIDDFSLRVLKEMGPEGIFVPGLEKTEQGFKLLIPIARSVLLERYFTDKYQFESLGFETSLERVADIIVQAINIEKGYASYMLGDSVLVKRLKYTYVAEGCLRLICIPSMEARSETDNDRDFYRSIVAAAPYTEEEVPGAFSLLEFINSEEFDVDGLLCLAEKILADLESAKYGEEFPPEPQVEKPGLIKRIKSFFYSSKKRDETLPVPTNGVPMGVHILSVRSSGNAYPLCIGPDIIGTDENTCSICFPQSKTISKNHCKVYFEKNRFYIEDLGSENGTYLNGIRLEPNKPRVLISADMIRVGEEQFMFYKRL